jgi:GT2 family glycosyltransferase
MAWGEVIAFTDDDCLPAPDWLKEGVEAIRSGLDGISGRVIVPILDPPTDYEKNISRLSQSEFVTANCFYRRSALQACGGFDERFTMAWREDADLFFNLLTRSYRLEFAPTAKVLHPVRQAPWGVSIREQRKSIFNALLFKKYPKLYREHIQSHPPLRYYAILFSIIGFLTALLIGNGLIAWMMALLWVGLTLQFAFQRLRGTKHTFSHILEMLFTSSVIPPLSIYWRFAGALRYRVLFF